MGKQNDVRMPGVSRPSRATPQPPRKGPPSARGAATGGRAADPSRPGPGTKAPPPRRGRSASAGGCSPLQRGPILGDSRRALILGDCIEYLRTLPDCSVDAIVTDPPYGIGFMGRKWDSLPGVPFAEEALRVLKPGGYCIAFGATRTMHRLTVCLEDAGFEVRDTIHWLYYNGNPASVDLSKVLDHFHGVFDERPVLGHTALHSRGSSDGYMAHPGHASPVEGFTTDGLMVTGPASDDAKRWEQYGTGLNPAIEPAVLVRKEYDPAPPWPHDTRTPAGWRAAHNLLTHGVGGLDIKGCRIPWTGPLSRAWPGPAPARTTGLQRQSHVSEIKGKTVEGWQQVTYNPGGRWPGNVIYCPKPSRREKEAGCEALPARTGGDVVGRAEGSVGINNPRAGAGRTATEVRNTHVTVKPIDLMRWLVRLVCPPDGIVLDPFMGSGTTGCAAALEGRRFVGCEREAESYRIAEARVAHWERVAEGEQWTKQYGSIEGLIGE